MKTINKQSIINSCLFIISILIFGINAMAQKKAKIYMSVVSHNEDEQPFNTDKTYYLEQRQMCISLAKIFKKNGMKWNLQTDWTFLEAVELYDNGKVVTKTNGKNILKWLYEDLGFEIDAHCQESEGDYLYADVAQWIEKLGVIPSSVVGGFLYDTTGLSKLIGDSVGLSFDWTKHQEGSYSKDSLYFYKPDYLWGASTAYHTGVEDETYGMWIPKDFANFYTHDATQTLAFIGHGCKNTITDKEINLENLFSLLDSLNNGSLPESGFYTSSLILHQNYFEEAAYDSIVSASIDQIKKYDTNGRIQWDILSEVGNKWKNNYKSKPYQLACDEIRISSNMDPYNISGSIENIEVKNEDVNIYPNPAENILHVNSNIENPKIELYNSVGELVLSQQKLSSNIAINISHLHSGIYYIRLFSKDKLLGTQKLMKK
jgi:hypothetical protein